VSIHQTILHWPSAITVSPYNDDRKPEKRKPRMDSQPTRRTCPECGSDNYTFRSRKQIEATPDHGPMLETKYKCKDCEEEWKEKTPGVLKKPPRPV